MFQVERYGEEKRVTSTAKDTAKSSNKTHRDAKEGGERERTTSDKGPSWRDIKSKKKRWAEDIEREMDAKRGESASVQTDKHPHQSNTNNVTEKHSKKRTRGGAKNREKRAKLVADSEPIVEAVSISAPEEDRTEPQVEIDAEVDPNSALDNSAMVESDSPNADESGEQNVDVEEDGEPAVTAPESIALKSPSKLIQPSLKSQGLPHWLENPIRIPSTLLSKSEASSIANSNYNLSKHTQARLSTQGIDHLFPVQQAVLPRLLLSRFSSSPRTPPGDLLVSSATGSGKTLAYVLPILEYLISGTSSISSSSTAYSNMGRVIPRLRALIVVPTRDLAVQVKTTFEEVSKGSQLRIGVVTGSISFHAEQEMLVETINGQFGGSRDVGTENGVQMGEQLQQCSSKVDIVVATPGRLTDHLKGTPGFTLRHLRFLVLDEADRLLVQDYHGWLNLVLNAVKSDAPTAEYGASGLDGESAIAAHYKNRYDRYLSSGCVAPVEPNDDTECGKLWTQRGLHTDNLHAPLHNVLSLRHEHIQKLDDDNIRIAKNGSYLLRHHTPLQKLLFSATLTRNPEKIAALQLVNPTYIAVSNAISTLDEETPLEGQDGDDETEKFTAPPTLKEHMIVVPSTSSKPLILMHILFNLNLRGLLIFTRSVESAHRLASLIGSVAASQATNEPSASRVTAQAITSDLGTQERKRTILSFKSGKVSCLVASDVMARGMDLGESVLGVVNYDVPTGSGGGGEAGDGGGGVKTYVHRVGRTARAGRDGQAWSLVEEREARWFKKDVLACVRRVGGEKGVLRVKVGVEDVGEELKAAYEVALGQLAALVKGPGR
ncbi:ATP-dependent RNA helicase dbp6 [Chytriomyces hyalinus]|nr:ATP-dependent RNA helicase dbp6 [Chytriomyces hyalinus]